MGACVCACARCARADEPNALRQNYYAEPADVWSQPKGRPAPPGSRGGRSGTSMSMGSQGSAAADSLSKSFAVDSLPPLPTSPGAAAPAGETP